ncbi:hypothetical protein EJB05_00074, partial [Eragrostis curvula]
MHGSQLRVAYQGVPGAYGEKAYPGCDAIACDQFEVELWIADRAVLAVENLLGGSIHSELHLLLRHIVAPCAPLAIPGALKECLSRWR